MIHQTRIRPYDLLWTPIGSLVVDHRSLFRGGTKQNTLIIIIIIIIIIILWDIIINIVIIP